VPGVRASGLSRSPKVKSTSEEFWELIPELRLACWLSGSPAKTATVAGLASLVKNDLWQYARFFEFRLKMPIMRIFVS